MGFFDKFFKKKKVEEKTFTEEELQKELEIAHDIIEEEREELDDSEEKGPEPDFHEDLEDDNDDLDDFEDDDIDEIEEEEEEKFSYEVVKENRGIEKPTTEKKGFFASLKDKLFNSRNGLFGTLKNFFTGKTVVNTVMFEELEEILVQSDIGLEMTLKIIEKLESEVKKRNIKEPALVYPVLKEVMEGFLVTTNNEMKILPGEMNVILIVGVNGVGKTTTIGKLASKYTKEGKKVVIGAGDTFRAAAVEQVEEWARRAGAAIIKPIKEGGDPGAVVFDTLKAAKEMSADVVIIDTAGRLHNKSNLMQELEKINNIIKKNIGEKFYESILIIDGTTGQNALAQAKVFNEVTKLTGFVVTKLDGTAKGGVLFSISEEIKKPIKFIGVGEKIEDLRVFNVKEFINAIFD